MALLAKKTDDEVAFDNGYGFGFSRSVNASTVLERQGMYYVALYYCEA